MCRILEWFVATHNPRRFKFLTDKSYLSIKYHYVFGKPMNWKNPSTFEEKLQWLKLYNRNPSYTKLVDKYEVKKYIADSIGAEYVIPTIGVWDSFDQIDFNKLPNQFVLKCTHDSGGLVICRDKNSFDIEQAEKIINVSLRNNYYYSGREWPYKNVTPRIIAEQYMADDLLDYMLLCFDGMPRMTLVFSESFLEDGQKEVFYDEVWNILDNQKSKYGTPIFPMQRKKQYELIKSFTAKLSQKISFEKIDFYKISDNDYLGKIVSHQDGDLDDKVLEDWDQNIGKLQKLPGGYRLENDDISITFSLNVKDKKYSNKALVDYKFFCFNGVAEVVMVCIERETGNPKFYFFDKSWNLKRYNKIGKAAPEGFTLPKPECMDEMFSIAEKLSKGFPYVRVDLYCIDGLIYFGEITFFPDSGFDANILPEADDYLGRMLVLPEKRKR